MTPTPEQIKAAAEIIRKEFEHLIPAPLTSFLHIARAALIAAAEAKPKAGEGLG